MKVFEVVMVTAMILFAIALTLAVVDDRVRPLESRVTALEARK